MARQYRQTRAACAVHRSEDSKLTTDPKNRPIAVTYAAQQSCPLTCPFRGNGCYAETGHTLITTRRVNGAGAELTPEAIALEEAWAIRALPAGWPLRLHVVGDCSTDKAAQIVSEAADEYRARVGSPVWTYTHAWRDVERASWGNVSVLASCETAEDVKDAVARGYATAIVVTDRDSIPADLGGTKPFLCPQQTGARPDCASCMVCAKDTRIRGKATVVLLAHSAPKKIRNALALRMAQ